MAASVNTLPMLTNNLPPAPATAVAVLPPVATAIPVLPPNPAANLPPGVLNGRSIPGVPKDVRDMILKALVDSPRVIVIHSNNHQTTSTRDGKARSDNNYIAKATVLGPRSRTPQILQLNRDFRREWGRPKYTCAFGPRLGDKPIYINIEIDTVYVPSIEAWKSITQARKTVYECFIKHVASKILHLAIRDCMVGAKMFSNMFKYLTTVFAKLKSLTLKSNGAAADQVIRTKLRGAWDTGWQRKRPGTNTVFPVLNFASRAEMVQRFSS